MRLNLILYLLHTRTNVYKNCLSELYKPYLQYYILVLTQILLKSSSALLNHFLFGNYLH